MSWTRDFRAGTITMNAVGDASTSVLRGLSSVSLRANSEVRKELASGSIYNDTAALDAVKPAGSITTYDIPGAITMFGLTGRCWTSDGTHPGLVIYSQKQACAGVSAGSVHDAYQIRTGLMVPRSLSVEHRGNCAITYDFYATYDGSNAPVTRNVNQELPASATQPIGRWTMSQMKLSNVAVEGKRSISIDWNPSVAQEGADSEFYDSVNSIASIMPRITTSGVDTSWFITHAPLNGTSVASANSWIELKKRNALLTDDVHIKLSFAGLVTWDTIFDGSISSPSTASFAVDTIWDGVNAPITAALNQEIDLGP